MQLVKNLLEKKIYIYIYIHKNIYLSDLNLCTEQRRDCAGVNCKCVCMSTDKTHVSKKEWPNQPAMSQHCWSFSTLSAMVTRTPPTHTTVTLSLLHRGPQHPQPGSHFPHLDAGSESSNLKSKSNKLNSTRTTTVSKSYWPNPKCFPASSTLLIFQPIKSRNVLNFFALQLTQSSPRRVYIRNALNKRRIQKKKEGQVGNSRRAF